MPFLVTKRSDIADGALQIIDLWPNTSQRNTSIDAPGQTKYLRTPRNDSAALTTSGANTITIREANGLTAWFLANVPETAAVASEGDITVASGTPGVGDTIDIGALGTLTSVAGARTSGSDDFSIDSGTVGGIAAEIAAAINDPANSFASTYTAVAVTDTVTITAIAPGTAGDAAITLSDGVSYTKNDIAGGVDAAAATAAEAATNADDLLTLMGYDAVGAPGALTLAAINGAITNGAILASQLPELLAVLAGADYIVPAGHIVETSGVWQAPTTLATDNYRPTHDGIPLRSSLSSGMLSGFTDDAFSYLGSAGRACVVYANDGTVIG